MIGLPKLKDQLIYEKKYIFNNNIIYVIRYFRKYTNGKIFIRTWI